ncbi:MAG: AraC family transcriptional regulator [Saprospiraceae bacterium]|nr:AraC family transcriptional regulator [Saprospiraceae bacterium]
MGYRERHSREIISSLLECDTIHYKPHRFPWHLHPGYYSFSLVVDGWAELIFQDGVMTVKAGDVVFIPACAPHQTVVEDFFTNIIVRVSTTFTDEVFPYSNTSTLIRQAYASDLFSDWYRKLRQENSMEVQRQLIHTFLQDMSNLKQKEERMEDQMIGELDKVRVFLHEHYGEPIQLQTLSQISHMSPSHFQRRFRQAFGISPIRYLQSLRVDRAKGLIKQALPMTSVALQTGFYDQSHFNKYFKLLTGMSPGRYQAIIQND